MNYYSSRAGSAPTLLLMLTALLTALTPSAVLADASSARQAMDDPDNPLVEIATSRGSLFVEMLPAEAPANVANFLGLAQGEIEITDPANGFSFSPRYYDGMRFHRVIPDFVIQAGSPENNSLGVPGEWLADEINAESLGLDQEPLLRPDGSVNPRLEINDREAFAEQVLKPLYAAMDITDFSTLEARQQDILSRLQTMSVADLYEVQGYSYTEAHPTRPIARGTVALANRGPDSNGPEFFIALTDLPLLSGKYTVIGQVVEGLDVMDQIGSVAIEPERYSRRSTVIYSVNVVDATGNQQ